MTDRFSVRAVIVGLFAYAITALAGALLLAIMEKSIPEYLIGTGGAALGGLTAVLARTSSAPADDEEESS